MKTVLYTTIAAAALSLGMVGGAQAAGAGIIGGSGSGSYNSGNFAGGGAFLDASIGGNYDGTTWSHMDGTSGVGTSLEANWGSVNSQAFVAGGNVVGSFSGADFSNPMQPFQNSTSYQIGANFEQSSAYSSNPFNSATVDAASFQNFETGASNTLSSNVNLDLSAGVAFADWDVMDVSWDVFGVGFGTW